MPLTRRRFIQSTSALAALSAISPLQAAANDRINIGVVGVRSRGKELAGGFHASGQFNLVAVCDCDDDYANAAAAAFKDAVPALRVEHDFRRLLEDKSIDAIAIATPDHWHALMTVMALDAGKHVYVEKPVSHNIDEGKAMVAAHRKHPNLAIQVGTQQRSGRHFQDVREFIRSGALGKIAFVRTGIVQVRQPVPIVPDSEAPDNLDYDLWTGPAPLHPYNKEKVHYNWHFFHDYGTGDLGNWGAHWFDIAVWTLDPGYPTAVSAAGGTFVVHDAKEFPDTQTILYEYPDFTLLAELRLWSSAGMAGGMARGLEFSGEKGTVLLDRSGWTFLPRGGEPIKYDSVNTEKEHYINFADAVRGHAVPIAPIEQGHKVATLCHLGNIATRLHRRIEFDGEKERIIHDADAAKLMGRKCRKPWRFDPYL